MEPSPNSMRFSVFLCYAALPLTSGSPLPPLAIPSNNGPTSNETRDLVGYVSDPDGRGTISLLVSCTLTLMLCVWSALHLNLPQPSRSRKHDLPLYLRWIVIGVFGPELVVFTAWRQWCSARILNKLMQKQCAARQTSQIVEPESSSDSEEQNLAEPEKQPTPTRNGWTMTHSFFASSGGFVIDLQNDSAEKRFTSDDCRPKLVLTAHGTKTLALCGIVPDVSEAEIWDKSKANYLAKFLILVQASWMFLQVLGRLVAGLPVTLLEINTIAHVYA